MCDQKKEPLALRIRYNTDTMEQIQEQPARAWTPEETARLLVTKTVDIANYWAKVPNQTKEQACQGVAFSILSMLDGSNVDLPAFDLVPSVHKDDKQYAIDAGHNYFEPANVVSTPLHEMFHRIQKEFDEGQ